jgi:Cu/Ag efflux protein CusF
MRNRVSNSSMVKLIALFAATGTWGAETLAPTHAAAQELLSQTYSAQGVIKVFDPQHRWVSIAHGDIPGYMAAMTMSFEVTRPEQLNGLGVNDPVLFTFTATASGRRILRSIAKRTP